MQIGEGEETAKVTKTRLIVASITDTDKTVTAQLKKKKTRNRIRPRNKAFRTEIPLESDTSSNQATNTQKTNIELTTIEGKKLNEISSNHTMATSSPSERQPALNTQSEEDKDAQTRERELIKAAREAKKKAKLAKKEKNSDLSAIASNVTNALSNKTLDEIKEGVDFSIASKNSTRDKSNNIERKVGNQTISLEENADKKKPILSKSERRAIQEAQRAAKSQALVKKSNPNSKNANVSSRNVVAQAANAKNRTKIESTEIIKSEKGLKIASQPNVGMVTLFSHLERTNFAINLSANNPLIHPIIARLGEQYAKRTVVGSNARCMAFLKALKTVVQDFETPPNKDFVRSLETSLKYYVKHLQSCRPLAVAVLNAYKHVNNLLAQLSSDKPESESKERLCHFIDTYIENQVSKAAEAISDSMQDKIKNGDVILTYGCSSLINYICKKAHRRGVSFRVIVVDSRPFCEGQEMLRRLTENEISCTYVFINAVGFVMPEVTKVLVGAHALLSNGYVMARAGTAQVVLVARSYNVPVLVCCETHKFSERFQTDAIVYNELGDPDNLVRSKACSLNNWQLKSRMTPLNLIYDITPPELVTAVVTDVSILPCTSVPVILRIKPAEIGYYG